jgi:gamma-glutamylcyclotransferase (GGCT)/AIG2-like uncharacterized protein YtfP
MRVLVYGSLREGFGNHRLVQHCTCLGMAAVQGFRMVDLGVFPGLVEENTGASVVGEVYQVDKHTLATLDQLEGHPDFYRRQLVTTEYGEAWVYVLPNEYARYNTVDSGDWYTHKLGEQHA